MWSGFFMSDCHGMLTYTSELMGKEELWMSKFPFSDFGT
jgi:hypothetical protein